MTLNIGDLVPHLDETPLTDYHCKGRWIRIYAENDGYKVIVDGVLRQVNLNADAVIRWQAMMAHTEPKGNES